MNMHTHGPAGGLYTIMANNGVDVPSTSNLAVGIHMSIVEFLLLDLKC